MRALIISGVKWDSIWSHAHEFSRALSENYSVIFVDPPGVLTGEQPHLKVLSRRPRGKIQVVEGGYSKRLGVEFFIRFELNAIKALLKENPDIVIFYNVLPGFITFILSKLSRKKIIFLYVDDHVELLNNKIARIITLLVLPLFVKYSDGVISTARVLYKKSKKCPKAFYIPNGVHLDDLKFLGKIPHKITNVYFIGTLGKWVRIEDFISLAKMGFRVFVIGSGERFNELQAIAQNNSNIQLYGYVDRDNALIEIAKNCDLGIIPFFKNKLTDAVSPLKLFEFLALNKPVVASSTVELESFEGYVLLYSTRKDLIEKVMSLKISPKLIKEIIKKNKKVLRNYDWGSHLKKKMLSAVRIITGEEA
ncbi:glycosyltransferase [Thermococcus sp. 9N3]|uniref:glycosyltransferase n=1 Tax=Thermococcus sp. 9N3 TaxID=163002 RepID=UPI001431EA61|nr:glycosyltransferase [Thermococcus sp. 9N3]NJE49566.1 glycosyltransferase [Thermococcus sp. 9N3]